MIRLTWTKSKKPLSKAIRWIFNEPCSHFAIVFDDHFVFHSNLTGAHPTFFSWFLRDNDIVHEMIFETPLIVEDVIWDEIVKCFNKPRRYDWGAFIYFSICGLAYKILGCDMPKRNLWADSDSYLCVELAKLLDPILSVPDNLDITTPEILWLTCKAKSFCVNRI